MLKAFCYLFVFLVAYGYGSYFYYQVVIPLEELRDRMEEDKEELF
jgi:hypothetical protein